MAFPEEKFAKRSYLELERTTDHGNFVWKVISSNRLCHAHKHNIIAWSRMSYSLRSLCSSSRPGGSSNLARTCSNNSELPPAAWIKNHRARQRKWSKTLHKNHGWQSMQSQLKSKKKNTSATPHQVFKSASARNTACRNWSSSGEGGSCSSGDLSSRRCSPYVQRSINSLDWGCSS